MAASNDGNQSFSGAHSAWASLVVDQIRNSLEEDDYNRVLDFDLDDGRRSVSVETNGKKREYVNIKTFEHILQAMVAQAASLDIKDAELRHFQHEHRQEIENRDARLRVAETQLRALRADKEKAMVTSEEQCADADVLTLEEHKQIVRRLEDDAKASLGSVEAERSCLSIQLSMSRLEVTRLRNQVDNRAYPAEVLQELTDKLKQTVIDSCQSATDEANLANQALKNAENQIGALEQELDRVKAFRDDAQGHCTMVESEYNDLRKAYEDVQKQLALQELKQGQMDEKVLKEHQERAEKMESQLSELEKARDVALLDSEQLRSILKENEKERVTSGADVQRAEQALADAKTQLAEMKAACDAASMDSEQLAAQLEHIRGLLTESEEEQANAESQLRRVKDTAEKAEMERAKVEAELKMVKEALEDVNKGRTEAETQLQKVEAALQDARNGHAETEMQLKKMEDEVQYANVEHAKANSHVELVNAALSDATERITEVEDKLAAANEALKKAKKGRIEDKSRFQKELQQAQTQYAQAESRLEQMKVSMQDADKNHAEVQAQLEQLAQTMEALREARKGRTEALRENERVRLLYAESETTCAEAVIFNQELEQKISDLDHELQNTRLQLAEAREHLSVSERQYMELIHASNKDKLALAKAQAQVEKLEAARRRLAKIYGFGKDSPLTSPDRTNPPTQVGVETPRSSASLSPSAVAAPLHTQDLSGPPSKRIKLSRSTWPSIDTATSSLSGAGPGSSMATAISLDDVDDPRTTPTSPSAYRHNGASKTSGLYPQSGPILDIPKPVFSSYELFARVASWDDAEGHVVCGLCSLENSHTDRSPRARLSFDPLLYPAQFWNHCETEHKGIWRPDVNDFIRTEAPKSSSSGSSTVDEMREKFADLTSWKTLEGPYACGLCELENTHKDREPHPRLAIDSSRQPNLFWHHCRIEHPPFWKPDMPSQDQ